MKQPTTPEAAWLAHREARNKLEEAIAVQGDSHGIGRVLGKLSVRRANRAVIDTGEHLGLVEDARMHLDGYSQLEEAAGETRSENTFVFEQDESMGSGQIGDKEIWGN